MTVIFGLEALFGALSGSTSSEVVTNLASLIALLRWLLWPGLESLFRNIAPGEALRVLLPFIFALGILSPPDLLGVTDTETDEADDVWDRGVS